MDPDPISDIDRVIHGGTANHSLADFSTDPNLEHPSGLAGVYGSAPATVWRDSLGDYSRFYVVAVEFAGCNPDEAILAAGVIEVLRLAIGVTALSGDSVALPILYCGEYVREIRLQGGNLVHVSHDRLPETVDPAEYATTIPSYPANPVGIAYPRDELRTSIDNCRQADTPVIVDETYLGFTRLPSTAGLDGVITSHPVANAFGVPSLRADFTAVTGNLSDRFSRTRCTWASSALTVEVATSYLEREAFLEAMWNRVGRERPGVIAGSDWLDYDPHPADNVFVLFRVDDVDCVLRETRRRSFTTRGARDY